jgi:hypothetical protein
VPGRRRRDRRHERPVECDVSDQRWCSDVPEIACRNGQVGHVVLAVDCRDRAAIALLATPYSVSGDEVR